MKRTRMLKMLVVMMAVVCVFFLTSCSACSGNSYKTKFEEEKNGNQTAAENKIAWVFEKLDAAVLSIETEKKTAVDNITINTDTITSINAQISANLTVISVKEEELQNETDETKKAEISKAIEDLKTTNSNLQQEITTLETTNKELEESIQYLQTSALKDYAVELIREYPIKTGISGEKKLEKAKENYKVILISEDIIRYAGYIKNSTTVDSTRYDYTNILEKEKTTCTSCFFSQTNVEAQDMIKKVENGEETDLYDIVAVFTLQVTERDKEAEPLKFYTGDGKFFSRFFNNIFIFPVGWLLYAISSLFGGYYIIGLLITTLLIRTIGWPIYAKTNDMSLKMKAIEPEIAKIQAKYANRKDPDSERMMQMEQARLYKQHGIGIGGCLLPFLQFPIFMAVYRAVSRLPYTVKTGDFFTNNWANELNSKVFNSLNLFEDYTGKGQLVWVIILVILVAGTQFVSQLLSEARQKKAKDKAQEDIPMYRRQAVKQQANETQNTMKTMMYVMIFMMAVFVWTSKSSLGVYWLIGNLYSMLQTYINSKQSEKKLEKIREKQRSYK